MIKYWRLFIYRQTNKNTRIEQFRVLSNSHVFLCLLKNHHYLLLGTIIIYHFRVVAIPLFHSQLKGKILVFFFSSLIRHRFFLLLRFYYFCWRARMYYIQMEFIWLFLFIYVWVRGHTYTQTALMAHNKRNKFYHEKREKKKCKLHTNVRTSLMTQQPISVCVNERAFARSRSIFKNTHSCTRYRSIRFKFDHCIHYTCVSWVCALVWSAKNRQFNILKIISCFFALIFRFCMFLLASVVRMCARRLNGINTHIKKSISIKTAKHQSESTEQSAAVFRNKIHNKPFPFGI